MSQGMWFTLGHNVLRQPRALVSVQARLGLSRQQRVPGPENAGGIAWGHPDPHRAQHSQRFCVSIKDTGGQTLPLACIVAEVLS